MYDSVKEKQVLVSEDIFPLEAWELITKNKEENPVVILDVSTPQEYKDLCLSGAVNVNLLSRFFKSRLDAMDREKTYLVYCKVGGRSKIAQKLMVCFFIIILIFAGASVYQLVKLNDLAQIQHEGSQASKYVTLSIGLVSTIPTKHNASKEYLLAANKALYQAKLEGRDRVVEGEVK